MPNPPPKLSAEENREGWEVSAALVAKANVIEARTLGKVMDLDAQRHRRRVDLLRTAASMARDYGLAALMGFRSGVGLCETTGVWKDVGDDIMQAILDPNAVIAGGSRGT